MKHTFRAAAITGASLFTALLAACGGGGGDGTGSTATGGATASTVQGVAATGLGLANLSVLLTDSASTTKTCSTVESTSSFSCDVTGLVAPFLLKATGVGNGGAQVTLSSALASMSGATATANITPITNAIVATAIGGKDPNAGVSMSSLSATAISDAAKAYQTLLTNVLAASGVSSSEDLISGTLVVGNSKQDTLLDNLKVNVNVDGSISLSTLAGQSSDTPVALSIPAGSAAGTVQATSSASLPTSATIGGVAVSFATPFSAASLKQIQQAFSDCFNSTAAARLSSTASPAACSKLAVDDVTGVLSGMPTTFLNSGQNVDQFFNPYVSDDGMNKAQFLLPEIVRIQGTDASGAVNKVWANIAWVRQDGLVESTDIIVGVVKTPTSTDNGWRLIGNQRALNTGIAYRAQRRLHFDQTRSPVYDAASANGDFYVSEVSVTVGKRDKNGKSVSFAVVTGPGLPANGLFLRPSSGSCGSLGITAKLVSGDITGDDATVAYGKYPALSDCQGNFRVGGAAVDPSKAIVWPSNKKAYLSPALSDSEIAATLTPMASYTFKVYQNGVATVPAHKYSIRTKPAMVAPAAMRQLAWQDLSEATIKTLKTGEATAFTGGAVFPVSWTAASNTLPVIALNVQISDSTNSNRVVSGSKSVKMVAPGVATSASVPADSGASFPSVANLRTIGSSSGFSYVMATSVNKAGLKLSSSYEYDTH